MQIKVNLQPEVVFRGGMQIGLEERGESVETDKKGVGELEGKEGGRGLIRDGQIPGGKVGEPKSLNLRWRRFIFAI